jgi:hypothetical protein
MDWQERSKRIGAGYDVHWARFEAREDRARGGRTEKEATELREQAAKSATCCCECFRPLLPTDSVTMARCNFGRRRNPHWLPIPICLMCTLDAIKLWRFGRYETPEWYRTRCLNCSRPIRVYSLSLNARTCCADCRRAVRTTGATTCAAASGTRR